MGQAGGPLAPKGPQRSLRGPHQSGVDKRPFIYLTLGSPLGDFLGVFYGPLGDLLELLDDFWVKQGGHWRPKGGPRGAKDQRGGPLPGNVHPIASLSSAESPLSTPPLSLYRYTLHDALCINNSLDLNVFKLAPSLWFMLIPGSQICCVACSLEYMSARESRCPSASAYP